MSTPAARSSRTRCVAAAEAVRRARATRVERNAMTLALSRPMRAPERAHGVEGRILLRPLDRGVQPPAGDNQQRETLPGFLVRNADVALLVKRHSFPFLGAEYMRPHVIGTLMSNVTVGDAAWLRLTPETA